MRGRLSFSEFVAEDKRSKRRTNWHAKLQGIIAYPAAYLLIQTPISAPQVLGISLVTGLLGPICFMIATTGWMLVGVLFLFASMLLDACDGMVFRFRGQPAIRGAFLDRFNHAVIYPFTYFGVGVAAYRITGSWEYIVLGAVAGQFREAFETLLMYETRIIEQHGDRIQIIGTRDFFRSAQFRRLRYLWVAPVYMIKDLSNSLSLHLLAFPTMGIAILAHRVPELVWYLFILFAARFFCYAATRFALTYRGK